MKKGFTLIEMVAVIVILGIIGVIAVTSIDNMLKKREEEAYDIQIQNIIDGAKMWAGEHVFELPESEGEYIIISLSDLKKPGYVKNDITNPLTEKQFSNSLKIKITVKNNNYTYEIIEEN